MSTAELVRSRDMSVVAARPRAGTRVQFSAGRKRFFSLSHPDPFWAPSKLLYIVCGPAARYPVVTEEGGRREADCSPPFGTDQLRSPHTPS